jgi:hypothetical protein
LVQEYRGCVDGGIPGLQVLSTLKKGSTLRIYGTLSGPEATVKIRDIMAGAPHAPCCMLLQSLD